jgi:hypothetical protein
MKQLMIITCLAFVLASCTNKDKDKTASTTFETKTDTPADVTLPIPLAMPYRKWQIMPNNDNTIAALTSLKAFIDKDFTALAATLGDTVDIKLDGYAAKLSRDSVVKVFSAQRPMYVDLAVTMYDYESVISADKKDEYVTLWYKQTWKDEKGKTDSMNVVDDCKMKNGKMIELDEKVQRFPAKK